MRDIVFAIVVGAGVVVGLLSLIIVALEAASLAVNADWSQAGPGSLILIAELGLLAPVWALGIRKYGLPWSAVGFRPFEPIQSAGLGCLFLLFAFGFNVVWALLMGMLGQVVQPDFTPLVGDTPSALSLALIGVGVVAPIAEEVFFRGFVFAGLRQRFRLVPALAVSAALFAVAHLTPTSWPPLFVLGVLFALLYEQTRSIWPAVIMHGLINSMAFVVIYLSQVFSIA